MNSPNSDRGFCIDSTSCHTSNVGSYRQTAFEALPSGYSPPAIYILFCPLTTNPCLLENNLLCIFDCICPQRRSAVIRLETCNYSTYLTANGRHANGFHNLPDESQYSTDLKTTLSSSPPTETITYKT